MHNLSTRSHDRMIVTSLKEWQQSPPEPTTLLGRVWENHLILQTTVPKGAVSVAFLLQAGPEAIGFRYKHE